MNKFTCLFVALLFYGLASSNFAIASSHLQNEISHLINFVSSSDCIFIRNGSEYDAKNAAKHLQKKYKHFNADINSSEKFIALSATKSTLSNKPYFVRCGNSPPITSRKWLLDELKHYRVLTNIKK